MKDPYKTLGVPRTASRDDVKKAYRKKAKQAHPDRAGGSNEQMSELNRAYALLEDPAKRARYDAGEDPDRPQRSIEEEAEAMILSAMEAVYSTHKDSDNLADALKKTLVVAENGMRQELAKADRAAKKANRVLRCLKNGDRFRPFLEAKAEDAKRAAAAIRRNQEILHKAIQLAASIGWEDPEAQNQAPRWELYQPTFTK